MVEQVRRFNRAVTQSVGALSDTYLSRLRPLGQARVLWEVGPDGCDARALRSRLDLDSGYLSRVLRALESDGLVEVVPSHADGRVRTVRLTRAGQVERAELDSRSDDLAAALLTPLDPGQRARLVAAMAEVERLMLASAVRMEDPSPRAPGRPGVPDRLLRGAGAPVRNRIRPAAQHLRHRAGADPAGRSASGRHPVRRCGGLRRAEVPRDRRADRDQADVGRTVGPRIGAGGRLLAELERHALEHRARTVRLETNRALTEAIGLYRSRGYRRGSCFQRGAVRHHWFEKDL